jgi:Uma2 family endonuclease
MIVGLGTTRLKEPRPRRWTKEELYQLLDYGFFLEQRVELIDGEIIEVPAQSNYHAAAVVLTCRALEAVFGTGYWARSQGSLDLSPSSVPDPDVAVVPGSPKQASQDNPTTALLVVEVADTSLSYDRNRKASLYAAAGIQDYWIVNLVDGRLEVLRNPVADASQPFGHRYGEHVIHLPGMSVAPLAAPSSPVAVSDLLPQ